MSVVQMGWAISAFPLREGGCRRVPVVVFFEGGGGAVRIGCHSSAPEYFHHHPHLVVSP